MDLETGNRFLTAKVQEWAVNQDFTLKNAALNDASVDYLRRGAAWISGKRVRLCLTGFERMADDALMRIAERSRKRNGAGMTRMPTKKMLFWPFYRIISATVWRSP